MLRGPCLPPHTTLLHSVWQRLAHYSLREREKLQLKKGGKWQQCGKMRRKEQKGVQDLVKAAPWQPQKGYGSQSLNVTEDGESGRGKRVGAGGGGCMEVSRLRGFQRRGQGRTLDEWSVDFVKWSGGQKSHKAGFVSQTAIGSFFFKWFLWKKGQLWNHNKWIIVFKVLMWATCCLSTWKKEKQNRAHDAAGCCDNAFFLEKY